MSVRRSRESAPALTVVPDAAPPALPAADELDEDAVLAAEIEAELAASLLAESATGSAADISAEITAAETLVAELDRDIHGGVSAIARREDRWRSSDELTDDELVLAARCGDDGALAELLTKYRAFARVKARSYFLVGADREDIVQEGMIGLYKAIRDFNPDMQSSFRAFAELCVTRQIITAIKTATRQKHGPLNNYVSFSRPVGSDSDGDGERVLGDVI
ncbi:MAG: polymerase sporulation-specific sigma factor, partial [Frankiales bacterium]|nr:polymerase sporulation-specific sigma factor [Frankiales bacterium]